MKDLDFDELDQAVSSVLGNDTPDENKIPATASPVTESVIPAPAVPAPEALAAPEPAARPASSPAVRRRGQFLDMVHPSADMTSRTPVAPAARKRIAPVSKDIAAPSTTEEKAAASAAIAAVESESAPVVTMTAPDKPAPSPVPAAENMIDANTTTPPEKDVAWPDPLDLTPADTEKESVPAAEPETTESTPAETIAPAEASPTPFVTDAKVDKRPLGAFGSPDADAEPPADMTPDPVVAVKSNLDEQQRPPDVTPPELQPDVVSVESADQEFATEDAMSHDDTPANSGLSQSIPQQYRTPADAPDQTPHPIFDTDEYHQPLLPATHQKKKRGWLVVVIILALLVIGSALGYFAFVAGL